MLSLNSKLVGILLGQDEFVSEFQVEGDQFCTLFLLLLDLSHQVLDHGVLSLELERHRLVGTHCDFAFVDDCEVDIPDIAHFVDYLLQVSILFL